MGMPTVLSANGTATSTIWFPDWMQSPFSVSFAAIPNAAASGVIQATFDNIDISSALGGPASVTAGSATWFTVASVNAGVNVSGVISMPVRGLQISLLTAGSTGICTATFIQATFPR